MLRERERFFLEDGLSLCLCEGRHEMPKGIKGAIFGNEVDPTKPGKLEAEAILRLHALQKEFPKWERSFGINLVVTGLTVALIAFLNVCKERSIPVCLWHYDKATGDYYPQAVY